MTIDQVAERWQCSPWTVRRLLEDQPGVVNLGTGRKKMMRIPPAVVERVEADRSSAGFTVERQRRGSRV